MLCSRAYQAILAIVILATGSLQPLDAQTPESPSDSEPQVTDSRDSYTVGFSELSAIDLPAEFRYLATSLPRLIIDEFDSGVDGAGTFTHRLSDAEREAYALGLIERDTSAALRAVSSAVAARDRLLFESQLTPERRESAEEAVLEATRRLDSLTIMDASAVELEDSKPIVFWSGRDLGRLLPPVTLLSDLSPDPESLQQTVDDADLDLLIWGTAEEIRGYLKVDFYAWSPHAGHVDMPAAGTVALPSDVGQDAELITAGIVSVLLGKTWGSVFVQTNVSEAQIYADGTLIGFGSASSRYRDPGEVTIDVAAAGYRSISRVVEIPPLQTATINVDLESVVGGTVRIESAPSSANVYVDSVWTGQTPLELPRPASPQVVRVRTEGYLESRLIIGPDSPERIARALLPDTIVWADEITEKRDAFYRSLTWFVVSVPVTLILNGVYENVLSARPPAPTPELPLDEWNRLGQVGNIFYFSSVGGLMVNVGLLVNAAINLFEYLDVGEGAHNQ